MKHQEIGQATAEPADTPQPQLAQEAISIEQARELRVEATALRDRAKAAEDELKRYQDAELSASEKLKRDLEEAVNARDEAIARARTSAIAAEAARLGFAEPSDAAHFIPAEAEDIEAALSALATKKPYLLAHVEPAAPSTHVRTNPTSPARGSNSPAVFTKEQIADRAFWTANRDAIMKAIAEGRIVEG